MKARPDKAQQIMQAAERLFTTRRFHEITLDEVAAAAGVGKGTIYRYFQDKDDLFFQTATAGFDEMVELLGRKVPEQASFGEQLLALCRQISLFFERRQPLFRLIQAEDERFTGRRGSLRDRWMDRRRALVDAVAAIFERGVQADEIRSDIPPVLLAEYLLGMLRTRVRDLADAPEELRRYDTLVELFSQGAAARHEVLSGQSEGSEPHV